MGGSFRVKVHTAPSFPHELGVLGEAPMVAVPWLAQALSHLVALVEAHGHRGSQSHGCCSSVAPAVRGIKYLRSYYANQ